MPTDGEMGKQQAYFAPDDMCIVFVVWGVADGFGLAEVVLPLADTEKPFVEPPAAE